MSVHHLFITLSVLNLKFYNYAKLREKRVTSLADDKIKRHIVCTSCLPILLKFSLVDLAF